jgi:hypothetical protein
VHFITPVIGLLPGEQGQDICSATGQRTIKYRAILSAKASNLSRAILQTSFWKARGAYPESIPIFTDYRNLPNLLKIWLNF